MESNATRSFPKIPAMIMAGGKGERVMPLTEHRSKPAVPFAAKCRIVDADIKRCVIGRDTTIEPGASLEECIVLDGAVLGSKSRLRRVIIDRFNRLDEGTTIGFDAAADRTRFVMTKSGLVVLRQAYADSRPGLFQHATLH